MEKLFEKAVDAIVDGDITALKELLRLHPGLVTEKSGRDHHATLLHYTEKAHQWKLKTVMVAQSWAGVLVNPK